MPIGLAADEVPPLRERLLGCVTEPRRELAR
jgi:hypothetical protein